MCNKYIIIEKKPLVTTILINREEKLNALNAELLKDLKNCLIEAEQDNETGVVVIKGKGDRAFIAGADIQNFEHMNALEYRKFGQLFFEIVDVIMNLKKPVISVVQGFAFGGGCIIAMACDFIIASQNAKFGQQEINLGFMGAAAILPKLVGKHKASEIVMTGDVFSAEEAFQLGLVYKVVDTEELEGTTEKLAGKLLSKSPVALMLIKKAIRISLDAGYSVAKDYEVEVSSLCYSSDQQKRSVKEFLYPLKGGEK